MVFGLKSEPTITIPFSRINGIIEKSISLSPILCVMVSGTTLETIPERVAVPNCVVVSRLSRSVVTVLPVQFSCQLPQVKSKGDVKDVILSHTSLVPPTLTTTSGCLFVSNQMSVVGSIKTLPT